MICELFIGIIYLGDDMKKYTNFIELIKINKIYIKKIKSCVEEENFTPNEIEVLVFLSGNPEYNNASNITQYCKMSKSLVSRSIDSLIKKGYLIGKKSITDKRTIDLTFTNKAYDIVEKIKQVKIKYLQILFDGVTEEEYNTFFEVITKMNKNLKGLTYDIN